jgi:hypothetical protein
LIVLLLIIGGGWGFFSGFQGILFPATDLPVQVRQAGRFSEGSFHICENLLPVIFHKPFSIQFAAGMQVTTWIL